MVVQLREKDKRVSRLKDRQSGSWGTASAWYFHSVELVFRESRKTVAESPDATSRWVYAGLPVLIAGVEAFLIEHQHMLRDNSLDKYIAGVNDVRKVLTLYPLPEELRLDMDALVEVRNQIAHPSHVPFGAAEWPDSIKWLRDRKVLDGNMPQSGTEALALLASHKLFAWAVERCAETLDVVASSDPERSGLFRGSAGNLWRVLKPAAGSHGDEPIANFPSSP